MMNIQKKLLISFSLLTCFSIVALSLIGINNTSKIIKTEVLLSLNSIADAKVTQILQYVETKEKLVRQFANQPAVKNALQALSESFSNKDNNLGYIQLSSSYKPILENLKNQNNDYNLFLVNPEGTVVFSAVKEAELGTNLYNGPYKETQLGRSVEEAATLLVTNISKFEPYAPSQWNINSTYSENVSLESVGGREFHSAFVSAPVFSNDKFLGVVAIQLRSDEYFYLSNDYTSLKESGEIVIGTERDKHALVISPLRLRDNAQFNLEFDIGSSIGIPLQKAVRGESGVDSSVDYIGTDVLAAWRYISELDWGLVVKISAEESFRQAIVVRNQIIFSSVVIFVLCIFIAYYLTKLIAKPIEVLIDKIENSNESDLEELNVSNSTYEVQRLLSAFNKLMITRISYEDKLKATSVHANNAFRQLADQQFALDQHSIVGITDVRGVITHVNDKFVEISGYSKADLLGSTHELLRSGMHPDSFYADMYQTIANGKVWAGEFLNVSKSGRSYWVDTTIVPFCNQLGEPQSYVSIQTDITHRKLADEKIFHQANFDFLTDLPNRMLCLDRLNQLIKEGARLHNKIGVMFIDLDDFKNINDTLGHEIGDQMLVEAASRLKKLCRMDDIVGRLGGDEFIVLLGNVTDVESIQVVAKNIIQEIKRPFFVGTHELIIGVSVGIAVYPDDGINHSVLLKNADSAMYDAKNKGKNTYSYFTAAMSNKVERRLALESKMRGALERNEMHVVFQPKIDVVQGTIVGVEALLRWQNAELGFVSPDEFIPITEQTNLIVPIGKFILEQSLAQLKNWQNRCLPDFQVAINVSPVQFRDISFLDYISTTVDSYGIDHGSIELEITEGVLMSGQDDIKQTLLAMSQMGLSIAMDDFGTGYSSLSYLRNFPFNTLKVDRSFINDIAIDKADFELVSASIAMAHSLGIKVVAEGVEDQQQFELLAELKCELAQGYLFSKPVSAEEITAMLIAQQTESNG